MQATLLNNGKSRSDMVAEFMNLSLTTDLTPENYPTLTQEQLDAAIERQKLITNKVDVAVTFANDLKIHTNVLDSQHPENDPAYLASIKVISKVGLDRDSVTYAIGAIQGHVSDESVIDLINNNWDILINPVGSKANPIKYESDLVKIYNILMSISTKSEYETEEEYSTRIKNYSDTAKQIYFETDVSSTYDAETQTLYLYDDNTRDTLSESIGFFSSYFISAHNINSTPYPIMSISGGKDDNIRLFYKASVSPEVASMKEDYQNLYKAVIGIKLDPKITFTNRSYNPLFGTTYWVEGTVIYLKVYNRISNEVYTENSFSTDVLDRFKRENSVVIDNTYMLMWQDDVIPDKMTWDNAKNYCTNLTLNNYNDWYLPNQSELSSLVDMHYSSNYGIDYDIPQIYNIFENTDTWAYFTSTEYPYGDEAEVISFHNGYDFMSESIFKKLRVRCARKLY